MIGMVDNHWLAKINLSDIVLKNGNKRTLRPAVGYFQMKRDNVIIYMGINIILNSINKGSPISPID